MVWEVSRQSGKFPDSLEAFQTVRKVSRRLGKQPDSLEIFSWSGNFPDSLKIFLTVWKVSGQCGRLTDCLETFQTVRKLSEQSGNCPDKYCILCSIVATSISYVRRDLALKHVCRESHLRTFGTYMSQK